MNLELYQYYSQRQVLDAFSSVVPTKAEGWFVSENVLIGLFSIGERSPDSHFCDASRFHWHARTDEVVPAPLEAFCSLANGYLFIKSPKTDLFAYVAQITHVGMYGGSPGSYEAAMNIAPPIPTNLLQELGGLYVHPDSDNAMDASVAALRIATTPLDRFRALQKFVEVWRGPLEECHGLSEADLTISTVAVPTILAMLYRWAGRCEDIMNAGYMSIPAPNELSVDEYGYVPICVECQWCGNYFIRSDALQNEDPDVYSDECGSSRGGAGYHSTGIGLSQFLWAYYLAFNVYNGPISLRVEINEVEFDRFKMMLNPLPVLPQGSQSCRAIQAYRVKIDPGDEALIFVTKGVIGGLIHDDFGRNMTVRAKSMSNVEELARFLQIDQSRFLDLP
ncbi:MAG: hypothetical protein U0996_05245 [Planctomycetaceae bacterium]